MSFRFAFLTLCILFANAAADELDELARRVPASEARPFMLANRNGTYFYGSTGESKWDSGWMGLWINRKRVVNTFFVSDRNGNKISLDDAECLVKPFEVSWTWKNGNSLALWFDSRSDTLYYFSPQNFLRINEDRDVLIKRTEDHTIATPLRSELYSEFFNCYFSCQDSDYSKAVQWAHLQLLFLLAEDDSLLYAGIPWFNEGWGRDTFISLPGLLVTGHTHTARKLLMRYADWIDSDSANPTYGRVPNRVRPGEEIAYNTADGTPWWIKGIYEYGLYSRDFDLWKTLIYANDSLKSPVVLALDGAFKKSDSLGFLKHGDGDSWMDAIAPSGPVTPRGNRAIEIQALNFASIDAAIRMAAANPESVSPPSLKQWKKQRELIGKNFLTYYLQPKDNIFFDRLKPDNQKDVLFRPNQLFASTVSYSSLLPPAISSRLLSSVCKELVHPYGVLSLSPKESLFHPFHIDEHYPKDDAYHNGIVWVWLSGPVKSALTHEGRADLALELADYEANLILNRGLVGSLPELLDAMPRKGSKEPNLSGTTTQAWSLAEFLRTTYQDFLGIKPIQIAGKIEPFWLINPRIPMSWGETRARVTLEETKILLTAQNFGDSLSVTLQAEEKPVYPIGLKLFDDKNGITGYLDGTEPIHFVYDKRNETAYADGYPTAKVRMIGWPYDRGSQEIAFAKPIKKTNFPSLKKPDWDLLSAKDFLHINHQSTFLINSIDSLDDDKGDGNYVYPADDHFQPGILDLTHFQIKQDSRYYYFSLQFKNLTQPGWHPEYGFQLTYAAVCFHDGNSSRREVGANSNYVFADGKGISRILYIGGGVTIEDEKGKKLCEFIPRSIDQAFGDTTSKTINFSLPKKYLPIISSGSAITVLIGAQDDHGGAGMGEFRSVKPVVEKWAGGGNTNNGSNIYDILYVRQNPESTVK